MDHDQVNRTPFEINKAKGIIAVINATGCIVAVNEAFQHFFQLQESEVLHKSLCALVVPDEKEKAAGFCAEALQGIPVYGYLAFTNAQQQKSILNITLVPLQEDGRITGACCFFKDATATVQKNKTIHDSEQRLKTILNNEPECVKVLALDGTVTGINPAGLEIVGMANEAALIGTQWDRFVHAEDREQFINLHQKVCQGEKASLQYRLISASGVCRWMDATAAPLKDKYGNVYATLSVTRDISDKKKAEIELQKLASGLQKIMDSSLDVICVFNKAGRFLQASQAAFHSWGYHPRELIGRHYLQLVLEEDRPKTKQAVKDLVAGAALTNFENRHLTQSGKVVPIVWSAIWDASTQEMYCIGRDASEKKKAEAQLKKQEERLERAKKMAKIGYWEYDIQQQRGYATDGLYEIYGLCRKKYPYLSPDLLLQLVHPDDKAVLQEKINNLLTEPMTEVEHRIMRPDGTVAYVFHSGETVRDANGLALHISGAVQDITERKEAEINLLLSEQKFRSLVQNGSDLIFIIDEQAVLQYVSPAIRDIAGYEPEELVGQLAFAYLHSDDMGEILTEFNKIKTLSNTGTATVHRILKKSGEWVWLESKGANLMNDSSIKGLVINSRDVTDRIQLQEKLDRELANRQKKITAAVIKAQEAERSQLGQELHDNVNQVLTTVKLYNEMVLHEVGSKNDILQKSIQHLQGCIDEIRSISKRLSAPTLGKISLVDSVHELIDSINLTNKLSIHYAFEGFEGMVISQDVHLTIYRIIQEQLNNIIKHAEAQNVFLNIRNSEQQLMLIIRDDGKGFDLKERRRGIGITNMITRAENMNGYLSLESAPDRGCILRVSLPLQSATPDVQNKYLVQE